MNLKSFIIPALLIILTGMLFSCDEGRLYSSDEPFFTEEGGTASFHGEISGIKSWPSDYTFALAGFEEGNDFALISKNIPQSSEDGMVNVVMTGIPGEVSTVELCIIDRLRRRIATFASTDFVTGKDTLRIDLLKPVDISMANTIQKTILNTTCANCHGASNKAAAGLNLTEGHSFREMVGIRSSKLEGWDRVSPGNSNRSLLYQILANDASSAWRYDHSVEIIHSEKIDLIRNWINAGAKY